MEHWQITGKAGWHGEAYILPSGEILQADKAAGQGKPRLLYNGDTGQATAYTVSGSLKDWQDGIARYAEGNSRLLLALGTALAAPRLAVAGEQNGGFHIYGDSSDGKTIAALTALSVFGKLSDEFVSRCNCKKQRFPTLFFSFNFNHCIETAAVIAAYAFRASRQPENRESAQYAVKSRVFFPLRQNFCDIYS